jgi:ribosomal protein S18 acetylase RimI-like enzyme
MDFRLAGPKDYDELVVLTGQESWNYQPEDFKLMESTGCAKTLIATNGRIMGMITVLDYGDIGWISNVLVDREMRRRGIGRDLINAGVQHLEGKRTITLFSTKEAYAFYLREGFKFDRDFHYVRYVGGMKGANKDFRCGKDAFDMDRECFGYRRVSLLRRLMEAGGALAPLEGRGFSLLRHDPKEAMVGPVVADDKGAGLRLLYAAFNALGIGSTAVLPDAGIDGVEEIFPVSRLYLGERPPTDYDRVFAFAGLEFG